MKLERRGFLVTVMSRPLLLFAELRYNSDVVPLVEEKGKKMDDHAYEVYKPHPYNVVLQSCHWAHL